VVRGLPAGRAGRKLGAGEGPLEWLGDLAIVVLERRDPRGERVEVFEPLGVSALRCRIEK
jgi:hypothetical protein